MSNIQPLVERHIPYNFRKNLTIESAIFNIENIHNYKSNPDSLFEGLHFVNGYNPAIRTMESVNLDLMNRKQVERETLAIAVRFMLMINLTFLTFALLNVIL